MTTPATASEPYTDAAPSVRTSTLSKAITGMLFVSTKTLPSFAVAAATVFLLPSTKTKVEERPSPLKFTFDNPWVLPDWKESGLFSEPLFTEIFLVISAIVVAPRSSIVSRPIIWTGEDPSVALPFI